MLRFLDKQFLVIIVNSLVNMLLAAVKIVVGFLFHSQLLIADGLHSASDLLTDIFAMVGLRLAKAPKDDDHPFGHGNLEYASSLTVSVLIFFVVYELIVELVVNWNTLATSVSAIVLAVSIATFIVKLLLSYYVLYQAKKLDSHTLKSSGLESLADAYSTIVVIAGLLLTNFAIKHNIQWLMYAEKIATIVVILMLLKAAWEIFFNSIVGIAGTHAPEEMKEHFFDMIKEIAQENEENFTITEFFLLKQGIDYGVFMKINFTVDMPLQHAAAIIENLQQILYADTRIKRVNVDFSTDF